MDLMSFPSLPQVLWYCGPFLASGPIMLLAGAGLLLAYLWHVYRRTRARLRGQEQDAQARGQTAGLGALAVVVLLIGLGHFYDVYWGTIRTALWWHIPPERIAEIQVERLTEEGQPTAGPPVTIHDAAALRDGFGRLADARAYQRNHESFRDGYRLRICEVGAADFSERYLTVYRRNQRGEARPLVIPHRGPGDEWTRDEGGEYLSPAFQQWVEEVVAPRFPD